MVVVRWAAVGLALLQVLAYRDAPYPEEVPVFPLALVTIGVLAAGNSAAWLLLRRAGASGPIRGLAAGTLLLDLLVAQSFVWLWAFDPGSALWAILFILPLEGAIKFQLPGALGAWVGVTALYVGREFWGAATFDANTVQWNSITFRMGIGLLIALVAGLMAQNLTRQRVLVEETLGRLREVDRLRSALVSTLAHDVRNPLAAIRGSIRMLLDRTDDIDPSTRSELLGAADRQAGRLERLAADLLDLARLEQGRLELALEDVPLAATVQQAVSYFDEQRAFEIRIDPALTTRADPRRLEQIVVNLVSNALRHGAGPYLIEAKPLNGQVAVAFRDHGPGVPAEERGQLFEPVRGDRDAQSAGFGLAIVKALAEAHGGLVEYQQNEPRGACFIVTLPLAGRDGRLKGSSV